MAKSDQDAPSLEKKLQQLEKIVAKMSASDLPLEKALAEFEQGVSCIKTCQELLQNAEQRIEILTRETGNEQQ
jgi:exodeoxyribonuclease VII small subunit